MNNCIYWYDYNGNILLANSINTSFMRYTEMNDVDGVEIYEGDIITHTEWQNRISIVKYINETHELSHANGTIGGGYDFGDCWDLKKIKVIGNIYENPELT